METGVQRTEEQGWSVQHSRSPRVGRGCLGKAQASLAVPWQSRWKEGNSLRASVLSLGHHLPASALVWAFVNHHTQLIVLFLKIDLASSSLCARACVCRASPAHCLCRLGGSSHHSSGYTPAPFILDLILEESSFKSQLVWGWDKLHTSVSDTRLGRDVRWW